MTKHNQNLQKILEPFKLYQFNVTELYDFFIFLEAHMDYIFYRMDYDPRGAKEIIKAIKDIAEDGIDQCEELTMRNRQ